MNPTMIKSYEAALDIEPYHVVSFNDGTTDSKVRHTPNTAARPIGTTGQLGAAAGEMADVIMGGIGKVKLGQNVDAGDALIGNTAGQARSATGTSGDTDWVFGIALEPGEQGQIIEYLHGVAPFYQA